MPTSISGVLRDWLKQKQLIVAVSRRMGVPRSTLAAELQGGKSRAKLGADELLPLVQAIRDIGYGQELDRILKRYVRELQGEQFAEPTSSEEFAPLLLGVMRGIGELSKSAAQISTIEGDKELLRLRAMIRTEVVPAVYKLEDIVESRLATVREKQKKAEAEPMAVAYQPISSGG